MQAITKHEVSFGRGRKRENLGAAVARARAVVAATREALEEAEARHAALPTVWQTQAARARARADCRRAREAHDLARAEEAAALEVYIAAGEGAG